jgi:glycosyltransferase involved in cell wall biosynthesis
VDDEALHEDIMKLFHIDDKVYDYALNVPTAKGGAERYAWLLLRALAADNWAVTVGVHERLPSGERTSVDGVQFVGLGEGHLTRVSYKFLKRERPDWWLWQTASHWLGPVVEIAKMAGVRTVFSAMHDFDFRLRQSLSLHPRLWPLYAWGLMRTDKILVQHRQQLAEIPSRWQAKVSVLPGVVTPDLIPPAHAQRASYVAWVAMIRQHKRPDVLIEIARRLPEIRFVVCGGVTRHRSPAGYSEQMVSAIQSVPNIEYLGHVEPEKSLQIIRNAAVFLSTSDSEGFPSTFLEAWASGTPVVSVTVDPDQLLKNKGLGLVSGSVQQAVADISNLIDRSDLREEIGLRARDYVTSRHAPEVVSGMFQQAVLFQQQANAPDDNKADALVR